MQTNLDCRTCFHVAAIMDGNGRWATRRGLPRVVGHRAGVQVVRRIVEAAPGLGISKLTLFAFSSDNWRRPKEEVGALMTLLRTFLHAETEHLVANGVRLSVIGRRDRLPLHLDDAINRAERETRPGRRLHLQIAFDYSSRESIASAAARLSAGTHPSHQSFGRLIAQTACDDDPPEVDLLIRSGGEKRLSDFLLWESAYAELWFTDKMWPDLGPDDLRAAVTEFRRRDRRFGGLVSVA